MADLIKIKFKNLKVKAMLDYIEDSNIKEKQILEIKDGIISSRGHNMLKTFVKSTECEISDLIENFQYPDGFNENVRISLPFNDLKKVIEMLKIYLPTGNTDDIKIDGEFECQYQESELRYVVCIFLVKSGKIKTKINMGEISMIQYLSPEVWENISSIKDSMYSFKITSQELIEIKKLFKFENEIAKNTVKEAKKFIIELDSKTITFSSFEDKWETDYATLTSGKSPEKGKHVFSSIIIDKMDVKKDHDWHVIKSPFNGQFCIVAVECDSTSRYLTVGQKYDKNAK